MFNGINNSEQSKRLQNYTPWGGQSGTGISISAQDPEIGKLLAKAKLSTSTMSDDEIARKLQAFSDKRAEQETPSNFYPDPKRITLPIIHGVHDVPDKKANQPKANIEMPRWMKMPNEKLIEPNSDLGKQIASGGNSDYEPVYELKGGSNEQGPTLEKVLVGYRLKADYDRANGSRVELY